MLDTSQHVSFIIDYCGDCSILKMEGRNKSDDMIWSTCLSLPVARFPMVRRAGTMVCFEVEDKYLMATELMFRE